MARGKAKEENPNKFELLCDDCGVEIFVDQNMVILHEELWQQVCRGKTEDSYCDTCIEKRMGRSIIPKDFKDVDSIYGTPLCNVMWLQRKADIVKSLRNGN